MFYENEVDDAKTVNKLFDFIVEKANSELAKDRFCFTKYVVRMGDGFLYLVDRVFFLDIVQIVLQI